MKYFIVIICSIILPIFSLKENIPKFCINCKFFIKRINAENKYGQCTLFPLVNNVVNFLVTGIRKNDDYFYCATVRNNDDMCGKEGKMYNVSDLNEKDNLFSISS